MGGGEGDQIKNFYQVNRSQNRVSNRSRKKVSFLGIFRDKFAEKTADFAGIRGKIQVKFRRKTIVKKKPISRKFSGQISLESHWFCADFTNVFNDPYPACRGFSRKASGGFEHKIAGFKKGKTYK